MREERAIVLRKIVAAVAAGIAAGTVAVAAPAQAANYNCDVSHVCFWTDADYNGQRQQISGFADYTDLNGTLHDRASSWGSSTRTQRLCVIDWVNGRATTLTTLYPGNRTSWVGSAANDRADAVRQC
jgi:hypothetical protein